MCPKFGGAASSHLKVVVNINLNANRASAHEDKCKNMLFNSDTDTQIDSAGGLVLSEYIYTRIYKNAQQSNAARPENDAKCVLYGLWI